MRVLPEKRICESVATCCQGLSEIFVEIDSSRDSLFLLCTSSPSAKIEFAFFKEHRPSVCCVEVILILTTPGLLEVAFCSPIPPPELFLLALMICTSYKMSFLVTSSASHIQGWTLPVIDQYFAISATTFSPSIINFFICYALFIFPVFVLV